MDLRGEIKRIGEVDADVVVRRRYAAWRSVERRRDKNGRIKGRQHELRSPEAEIAESSRTPHGRDRNWRRAGTDWCIPMMVDFSTPCPERPQLLAFCEVWSRVPISLRSCPKTWPPTSPGPDCRCRRAPDCGVGVVQAERAARRAAPHSNASARLASACTCWNQR